MHIVAVAVLLAAITVLGGGIAAADAQLSLGNDRTASVNANSTLRINNIEASNVPEGESVTYSIATLDGAHIHPVTGDLVYVPPAEGEFTITVTASAGTETDDMAITVDVNAATAAVVSLVKAPWNAQYVHYTGGATRTLGNYGYYHDGRWHSFKSAGVANSGETVGPFASSNFDSPHPIAGAIYYFEAYPGGGSRGENRNLYAQFEPQTSNWEIIANPVSRPAPHAPDIVQSVMEATAETIEPTLVGMDGNTITITEVANATKGTRTYTGTSITYTSTTGESGLEILNYTVTDNRGVTGTGMVTLILPTDPLSAVNDTRTTPEDTPINIDVLANDVAESATLSVSSPPMNGDATEHANGTITYSPNLNFNGDDDFEYTISRIGADSQTATVFVTVTEVDDPITFAVPTNIPATIPEHAEYAFNVTVTDVDNATYTFSLTSDPPSSARITPEGHFSWEPQEPESGTTYTITISLNPVGRDPVTREIMLRVTEDNNPPVFEIQPTGNATANTRFEVQFNLTDTDRPEQTLTVDYVSDTQGSEIAGDKLVWIPSERQTGNTRTIILVARDGAGGETTATIDITVHPFTSVVPVIAHHGADPYRIELGIDGYVEPGAQVTDDEPTRYRGEVTIDASDIILNRTGTYGVTYSAPADRIGNTPAPVTRTVIVEDTTKPVIRLVGHNSQTIGINTPYNDLGATVTDNDPAYATGTVTGTPATIDTATAGTHTITYTAPADGEGNIPDPVTRTVSVRNLSDETNQMPEIEDLVGISIPEDAGRRMFFPSISDRDGTVSITAVSDARMGTTDYTASTVIYTPNDNEHGDDSFTYTITDDRGNTATGNVEVTITPVNDPPVWTSPARFFMTEHEVFNFTFTASDVDGADSEITIRGAHGETGTDDSPSDIVDNQMIWTPAEFQAPSIRNIILLLSDDTDTVDHTVIFLVAEANEAPVFNITAAHNATVNQEFTYQLVATDADLSRDGAATRAGRPLPHPQTITYAISSQTGPSSSMAAVNPTTGNITWTPDEIGMHTLRVQALDDWNPQGVNTTTITIDVQFDDQRPPVITLTQAHQNPQLVELGGEYMDLGATVTDDNPAYTTTTATGTPATIDTTVAGNHTVTYTAPPDPSGKTPVPVTRTVRVQDTTKPVIDIGIPVQTINISSTYVDQNATVTDNDPAYMGTATPNATTADISTVAARNYTIEYTAPADAAGNIPDPVIRTVEVKLLTAPNIPPEAPEETHGVNEGATAVFMPGIEDRDGTATITAVGNASKGEATLVDSTTISYRPHDNEEGDDSFTYTVRDNRGAIVTGRINIVITGINDPPVLTAVPDNPTIPELDLYEFVLNATDEDDDDSTLIFGHSGAPAGLDITGNLLSWTPTEAQGNGSGYTFSITVSDDDNATDSQEVTFTVTEVNSAPVLDPIQNYSARPGTELRIEVNAMDADRPEQTLEYRFDGRIPDNLEINSGNGTITWTPGDQPGRHPITVTVSDTVGATDSQNFTIVVSTDNQNPTIRDIEVQTVNPGQNVNFQIFADDADIPVQTLTYNLTGTVPANATITTHPTFGRFDWTPTSSQIDRHILTVTVTDSEGGSTSRNFTVIVSTPNQNPTVDAISPLTVNAGQNVNFQVMANDADIPAQTLEYTLIGTVPPGAMINDTTGYFDWTPGPSQTGEHHITVSVTDGNAGSAATTFTITVRAPVTGGPNQNPAAPDILINAELFFPSAVTPAVTDPDGDDITITRVSEPTLGVLDTSMLPQISYTPNQTGIDRLNYTASDNRGGTDTGTITIFINPDGNARPELDHIYNTGGRVGVDLEFTATAEDSDDTSLTFDIANAPDGASITAGGDFSWRPASSQNGTHTVTFIVYDDSGGADWQHVLVTILRADETNLPPVPQDIDAGVVLGGGRGFQPDVSDPENDRTEIVRVYDSSLGDVDRSFTSQGIIVYVAGVLGDDEVIYTVSDGRGGFANGTLSITVEEPANVRPLIEFVGDKSVNAGDELTFTVDADDLDGFVINFGLEGDTQGPSMSPQGVFSWTPTANDEGQHEFTILVFDDAGDNSTVSITVTVRPEGYRNSPPVAPDVVIMTPQDVLSIIRPTLTDPDEGDPVRITQTGQTTKGSILSGFLRAGIIIYLPNQGEFGTETVSYTIADSSDDTDTATINVFISARGNTDPILGSIDFRNINAGDPLAFDLEAEDPDGDTISYQTVGAPDGIEISPQGAFSWTPTAADVGNHTFTVIAYDDRGGADSKTAVIRVLPAGTANQAPSAPDSTVTVAPGGSIVITPAISDPDGDRVTIDDAVASGTGVVIPSPDSINYIHVATTPTETITYTVIDARGATSTGTITVTVQ